MLAPRNSNPLISSNIQQKVVNYFDAMVMKLISRKIPAQQMLTSSFFMYGMAEARCIQCFFVLGKLKNP